MGTTSVVTYIGCLMVAGAVGNILVIYVFGFKYRSSAFNVLVTTLGLYDLVSCVIHMPLDILDTLEPDILPFSILCKSSCFLIALTVFSASIVLFTIAVLRYRGVSKPLGRTLQPKEAKCLGFLTLLPSLCLSWPALVMFENKTLVSEEGVTIHIMCGIHNPVFMAYSIVYHILLLILFVANLATMSVLYGLLSKFLVNRKRVLTEVVKQNRSVAISSIVKSQNENSMNYSVVKEEGDTISSSYKSFQPNSTLSNVEIFPLWISEGEEFPKAPKPTFFQHQSQYPSTIGINDSDPATVRTNMFLAVPKIKAFQTRMETSSVIGNPSTRVTRVDNQTSRPQRNNNNGILMMLLVTVVFCISYMPHLTYAMVFTFSDMETAISLSMSATTGILLRSFYLNNIANPIIYVLSSGDFRSEIKKIFVRQK